MNKIYRKRGFTLMELLISIAIIGILVTAGIASYSTVNKTSRDTKRKGDLEQIRSALEMYRADNGSYPSTGNGSYTDTAALESVLVPSYLPTVPTDPKPASQVYMYRATNASGSLYAGYCLSAAMEIEPSAANSCTPSTGQNFATKNP